MWSAANMSGIIGRLGEDIIVVSQTIAATTTSSAKYAMHTGSLELKCVCTEEGGVASLEQVVVKETKSGGATMPRLLFNFFNAAQSQTINTALSATFSAMVGFLDSNNAPSDTYGDYGIRTINKNAPNIITMPLLLKCASGTRALHLIVRSNAAAAIGDLTLDFYFRRL